MTHNWGNCNFGPLILLSVVLFINTQPPVFAIEPPSAQQASALNNAAVNAAQEGRFSEAVSLLEQAIEWDSAEVLFRQNLAGILNDWASALRQKGQSTEASRLLLRAVNIQPSLGVAHIQLGDIYFLEHDAIDKAMEHWTAALNHVDGQIKTVIIQRVALAERDKIQERGFGTLKLDRFLLKYPQDFAREEVEAFGAYLNSVASEQEALFGRLNRPVIVILYPKQAFARVAGRRDWAIGLYDGKIRLRVDELGTPAQQVVVPHELAHAYIRQNYGDALPMWINEGLAQLQEPEQYLTPEGERLLQRIHNRNLWVPLKWLDRRFSQPSQDEDIEAAYLQSKVAVKALVQRFGAARMHKFLNALKNGEPVERSFDLIFEPYKWSRLEQGSLP